MDMYMMNTTETATATYTPEFTYMTAKEIDEYTMCYYDIKQHCINHLDRQIDIDIRRCNNHKLMINTYNQELQGLNRLNHRKRYNWILLRLKALNDMLKKETASLYNYSLPQRDIPSKLQDFIMSRFYLTDLHKDYVAKGLITKN